MNVPDQVREELRTKLWEIADELDWVSLSPTVKSKYYEIWTRDPAIGGLLSRYIDLGYVRVYLKDTLLKDFAQHRLADQAGPSRMLDIPATAEVAKSYVKPHGRRFKDGRIICWGKASAWKSILMAAYERAYGEKNFKAHGVILTHAAGRYSEPKTRGMVEAAAERLGIDRVVWKDG